VMDSPEAWTIWSCYPGNALRESYRRKILIILDVTVLISLASLTWIMEWTPLL
jgi:hypothetical protein